MPQQFINIGSAPNDGTGDILRNVFAKCRDNFAELYDRSYILSLRNFDPDNVSDGQTVFIHPTALETPEDEAARAFVHKAGVLTSARIMVSVGGGLGSAEPATVGYRIGSDPTDHLLHSSVTFNSRWSVFPVTGLSQPLTVGDSLVGRIVFPTWASNPMQVCIGIDFEISY